MDSLQKNTIAPRNFLVGAGVLVTVIILLIPVIAVGVKRAKISQCSGNLHQLAKAMYNYGVAEGRNWPPPRTGKAFWLQLEGTGEIHDVGLFSCPMSAVRAGPGDSHYLGPSGNSNHYKSADAIGADQRSLNLHGDPDDSSIPYNWIAKSGDVYSLPNGDPGWAVVEAKLSE